MSQAALEATPTVPPAPLSESGLTGLQFKRLVESGVVSANPNVVHGAVVFTGTRVPVYNLWDYLNAGDSVEEFLESFPTVRREQVHQALEDVKGERHEREDARA